MTQIYEEVKGHGVLGVTCYQLQQLFRGLTRLDLYVKILLEHRVVGTLSVVFPLSCSLTHSSTAPSVTSTLHP
ncbi:hypothetical protein NP493_248g02019 [Ridgeia piscesae]|uniref:Uncharacterized protein n=1 Tax=Ridgeia piscesae TaxID=27915 RepID=A0AAD9NYX7_RIDPI|nr:hypothetical protein NP493_248g02019 [Ridgeia piscesae]